jgi:hypothetical protein
MASTFPGAIDSFTDPLSGSALNSPSHSAQHADLNDAVEKVETYMGLVKVIPTGATNGTVGATGTVTIGNAVSSVTVSDAFSATYDNYRILYTNGNASAGDILIQMTIGSPVSTYRFAQQVGNYGTGSVLTYSVSGTGGVNFWNVGYTGTSNETYSMIEIQSPFLAVNKTIQANGGRNNALIMMNGMVLDAVSRTDITFTPASGTLSGGTIRVYGYRN